MAGIAMRAKLANVEGLTTSEMISTIARGNEGIKAFFATKREKPVQEHKSLLDDFQL